MKFFFFISLLMIVSSCRNNSSKTSTIDLYVWSHNDYEQNRPLHAALELGFNMIEADIHLINEQIYVAHDHPENLDNAPLLENLYLEPLKHIISKNNGAVIPDSPTPFYLIIDVKTEAESTYKALKILLESYKDLFHRKEAREWIKGPIRLLISGNRPNLYADDDRIAFLDGRIPDLGKEYSSDLYPLISDNWNNYFSWDGTGQISKDELKKLRKYVLTTHQEDKMIRFWATPDRERIWKVLIDNGVDVINVDDLTGMRTFLDKEYSEIDI